jgi:fructokinase
MACMIVVAGEALIDLVVQPDGALSATPGGGPFNVARTIGRLGGQVAFLGCLSDDRFGSMLRDALVADGVDLSVAGTTDAPTTLAIAELDHRGSATYRFHTADTSAPRVRDKDVAVALARRPRALHVGTLGLVLEPMASALARGVHAGAPDTLVMLDPNCRAAVIPDRSAYLERLAGMFARADVVKASVDDLAFIDPHASPVEAAREIAERGPSLVIVTDGGDPVTIVTATGREQVPVPTVHVVDTIGAGDAFGGAFIARWIESGRGRADLTDAIAVRETVALATMVAAITCQRPGADPPRRPEAGWPSVGPARS